MNNQPLTGLTYTELQEQRDFLLSALEHGEDVLSGLVSSLDMLGGGATYENELAVDTMRRAIAKARGEPCPHGLPSKLIDCQCGEKAWACDACGECRCKCH